MIQTFSILDPGYFFKKFILFPRRAHRFKALFQLYQSNVTSPLIHVCTDVRNGKYIKEIYIDSNPWMHKTLREDLTIQAKYMQIKFYQIKSFIFQLYVKRENLCITENR
jgi:hypothetical protein